MLTRRHEGVGDTGLAKTRNEGTENGFRIRSRDCSRMTVGFPISIDILHRCCEDNRSSLIHTRESSDGARLFFNSEKQMGMATREARDSELFEVEGDGIADRRSRWISRRWVGRIVHLGSGARVAIEFENAMDSHVSRRETKRRNNTARIKSSSEGTITTMGIHCMEFTNSCSTHTILCRVMAKGVGVEQVALSCKGMMGRRRRRAKRRKESSGDRIKIVGQESSSVQESSSRTGTSVDMERRRTDGGSATSTVQRTKTE
jgi:hypothetical protein